MSLENELFHFKAELKNEEEKLAKLESIEIVEDENNPASIENRIEAKRRGIESCKEQIKEIKELIAEVKGELREFIENGGEVSQVTLDELKDADESEKDSSEIIEFKVVSNRNKDIYYEGCVIINEANIHDSEWFYYDGQGIPSSQMFIEHEGILKQGLFSKDVTETQKWEIEQFRGESGQESYWIDSHILESREDENKTYRGEYCTVIINDGAKIECEINDEDIEYFGEFGVEVIPKYNGKRICLAEYMLENDLEFDPYRVDDGAYLIDKGHIYFEMSKDYWADDEKLKQHLIKEVNDEVQMIYQAYLFSIIDFEDDMYEQFIECNRLDDAELFDLYEWANGKISAKEFAEKNGYEWEL